MPITVLQNNTKLLQNNNKSKNNNSMNQFNISQKNLFSINDFSQLNVLNR